MIRRFFNLKIFSTRLYFVSQKIPKTENREYNLNNINLEFYDILEKKKLQLSRNQIY